MNTSRKRYAIVGTGGRASMYVDAITGQFSEDATLVALCDLSQIRMDWYNQRLAEERNLPPLPTYHAEEFERMACPAGGAIDDGIPRLRLQRFEDLGQ